MNRIGVVLALVASVLLLGSACIGARTKQAAEFPPAELAWPGVRGDYVRGLADGMADGELAQADVDNLSMLGVQLGSAIDARDLNALRLVPWSKAMRPWADRGIADKLEDGEVGPTVAAELAERVVLFTETIQSLQGIFQ
jgi:hypothetical protein